MRIRISEVRITPANVADQVSGLLAWVACRYGGVRLDGLMLRCSRAGTLYLAYPSKIDARGRRRPYVTPVSKAMKRTIEARVLAAIGVRRAS